jgi:transposase
MQEYIALDVHKHYSLAEREDVATGRTRQVRIDHGRGAIRAFLANCPPGHDVALEAIGNWYWIADEIEAAGHRPLLVHPRKAKLMMGMINKTDKLDVHGLNRLQRNRTLPTVWLPPASIRDLREVTRTRLFLSAQCTRLKNRTLATLNKYGHTLSEVSDAFGNKGRSLIEQHALQLPPHTRSMLGMLLEHVEHYRRTIHEHDQLLEQLLHDTPDMQLLKTLPGVGRVLSAAMAFEIGPASRFPEAKHLAAYAGTTPRVHASGEHVRHGRVRPDVNRHLRWAFVEAANLVALNHTRYPLRHVSHLYRRLKAKRGWAKAIMAVARHLAEAAHHVLTRREPYRDPALNTKVEPGRCKRDNVMSPIRLVK